MSRAGTGYAQAVQPPDFEHGIPVLLGAGPVRIVGGRTPRILSGGERPVRILATYPVRAGVGLYSLATPVELSCAECARSHEVTIVAVREDRPVCPGCYADLDDRPCRKAYVHRWYPRVHRASAPAGLRLARHRVVELAAGTPAALPSPRGDAPAS